VHVKADIGESRGDDFCAAVRGGRPGPRVAGGAPGDGGGRPDRRAAAASPAALQGVLDRRRFAMPYVGTRIGDEDYPRLDPGDPDERRLLIEGEHPEYHDVLHDPGFDGEIDGVDPRLHVAVHEIVATQLWDDDPPEAWKAAQRLVAGGADRHDVLHRLAGVVATHLHATLSGGTFDLDAYRRDLDSLH
jgi:hypothetical protein